MIRVIYRWHLQDADESSAYDFERAWIAATHAIRGSWDGAFGSLLLRDQADPHVYVATARWSDRVALEAFWAGSDIPPLSGATLMAVEVFDEITDMIAAVPDGSESGSSAHPS